MSIKNSLYKQFDHKKNNTHTQLLLILCGLQVLLVSAEVNSNGSHDKNNNDNDTNSTDTIHVDVSKGLEKDVKDTVKEFGVKFENETHSKFIEALHNLTSYLPISVEYAQYAALECDILEYNKPYYERIPLIISAILIVAGLVFTFFGKYV